MADRLTQLQDCFDDVWNILNTHGRHLADNSMQLATQMFASLRYIQVHHSYAEIEGQPSQNPHPAGSTRAQVNGDAGEVNATAAASELQEPVPDSPEIFQASLRELARDLIMKEQQIEYLIGVLPGIGTSEADQNLRIQALEKDLRGTELERQKAMQERDGMLNVLGQLAASCKRIH